MTETIFIPGRPVAKERPRMGKGGRVYTPARTRAYETLVAQYAMASRLRFSGDVVVCINLFFKGGRVADADNYAKSILDGLEKGGLLKNDRQVTELTVKINRQAKDDLAVILVEPVSTETESSPTPSKAA